MTATEPALDAHPLTEAPRRSVWSAGFSAHLLALVVLLVGLGALTSAGDSFGTDDGSYALQLRALQHGSWVWSSGTERLDPSGEHYPIAFAVPTDRGWVPLAKHPAWPWLAHLVAPLTGVAHAYAALGLVAIAILASAAWLLAAEHDREWSRGAFWLAAAAPVVVTFTVGWAHAAAAAAAGLAVLGAVRLVRRGASAATLALLAAGIAAGILLRTEGVLVAAAVAVAIVVGGLKAGRTWWWSGGWAVAVAALATGVVRAEAAWVRSITGAGVSTFHVRTDQNDVAYSFLEARTQGAIRSLIDATTAVPRPLLIAVLVGLAVSAGFAAAGRRGAMAAWRIAATISICLVAARVVIRPTYPVTGLLTVWPAALTGVGAAWALLWRRLSIELTMVVLFAGAIVATQYPDGGALQWGGRFFAPITVPVAVVAVAGLARLLDAAGEHGSEGRRTARLVVVALVVLPLLLGVIGVRSSRSASSTMFSEIDQAVDGVAVTPAGQLPRMMWNHPERWLVVDADDHGEDLAAVLGSLARGGATDRVSLVLTSTDVPMADDVLARTAAWHEVDRRHASVLTVVVLSR
ncbi:hypothetical protein [Aquihabitans sp. McL0605]|uniref:hypothetical protein n=1 Tax=Aquihabitans sp. McL0605 TaxID=3415671 RepID=UPI003CED7A4E